MSDENTAIKNGYETDRWELLPSFRFILRVEGYFDVALKSIRPFTKENEFEQIEEGGMNDYVHLKRKHVTKPHTLQIERYLTEDFYDPIPNGTAFVLPLLLFVGGNNSQDFSWSPRRTYVFFGAQVLNKEIGGFDAEKSGLLTETVTIAYHQLYFMDTPGESSTDAWTFADNGISNKYANQGMFDLSVNKTDIKAFMANAQENLWEFGADAGEYLGNGVSYSGASVPKIPQNKKTLKSLERTAKNQTWHFGKDASEYLGNGMTHSRSEVVEDPKARPIYDEASGKSSVGKTAYELYSEKAKKNTWHFGVTADDYLGNKKLHANKIETTGTKPATTDEREYYTKKAEEKTWHFDKDGKKYTGNGKTRAAHNQNEMSQSDIEKNIKTWPAASYAMKYPWMSESKEDFLL
ncbi:MAG: hypothetical protein K6B14_03175 [Lachnospiraceae bacterium]|nr:hypothetical protein [Lachnospiraceae bacterium]